MSERRTDPREWVAATEEDATLRGGFTRTIMVGPGVRLFRVSDELAAKSLLDWSEPVQLKLEKHDDGTYDLIARHYSVDMAQEYPSA